MSKKVSNKMAVALLSVVSNTTLVIIKLIVGVVIGSVSVISEAIHSGVDLLAAVIAYFAVKASGKPADKEHPFGHGKFENVSGTIEALLIFGAAAWIIYEAIEKIIHPKIIEAPLWGVVVMFISAAANLFVSARLFKVGKETDSVALQADAWHLRTDVYTSAGVMAGLLAITFAKMLLPGVNTQYIDPIVAILVALLIIKAAWDLTVEAAKDLFDVSLPKEEETWVRECIESFGKIICGYHHLHTRKAGSDRFVECHLLVDSKMSVDESHQITDDITELIRKRLTHCNVNIHIEPADSDLDAPQLSTNGNDSTL